MIAVEPTSWNWCPKCEQLVDADDITDGSEVRCHGCNRVYTCVFYENGSWGLVSAEDPADDKFVFDGACQECGDDIESVNDCTRDEIAEDDPLVCVGCGAKYVVGLQDGLRAQLAERDAAITALKASMNACAVCNGAGENSNVDSDGNELPGGAQATCKACGGEGTRLGAMFIELKARGAQLDGERLLNADLSNQLTERDATIAVMREALERATRLCSDVHEEECPAYSDPLGDNVDNGCTCYLSVAIAADASKHYAERIAALEAVAEAVRDHRDGRTHSPGRAFAAANALDALEKK